jgi:hypothetical protein
MFGEIVMYKVHAYLDGKKVIDWRMQHLPRLGDEMRFSSDRYGIVKQVVWCTDEKDDEGQRVNLRIESQSSNI